MSIPRCKGIYTNRKFNSQVGYDDSFNGAMTEMGANPSNFIDGILAHLQVYYCDSSFGLQIKVEVSYWVVISKTKQVLNSKI